MAHSFQVGAVLHWLAFDKDKPDGAEIKPKYLLVIGAKQGNDCLMILATTQRHRKDFTPGCNAKDGYYYIPAVAKEFFKENTWLLLNEPKVASAAELVRLGLTKQVEVRGVLRNELVRAVINCLRRSEDIGDVHLSLL
jgi:hypothetical protein